MCTLHYTTLHKAESALICFGDFGGIDVTVCSAYLAYASATLLSTPPHVIPPPPSPIPLSSPVVYPLPELPSPRSMPLFGVDNAAQSTACESAPSVKTCDAHLPQNHSSAMQKIEINLNHGGAFSSTFLNGDRTQSRRPEGKATGAMKDVVKMEGLGRRTAAQGGEQGREGEARQMQSS